MKGRRQKVVRHVNEKRTDETKGKSTDQKEEKEEREKRCKKKKKTDEVFDESKKARKEVSRRASPQSVDNDDDEEDTSVRSDSPGLDLSVFQPRGKRKCVIRNESRKHRTDWWSLDVDEEEGKDNDEEGPGEEFGGDAEDEDYEEEVKSKGGMEVPKKRRKGKLQLQQEVKSESVTKCCYVFSTGMANRAGYAVDKGIYDTITAYHEAQIWDTPYLSAELHCGRTIPDDLDDKDSKEFNESSKADDSETKQETNRLFSGYEASVSKYETTGTSPLNSLPSYSSPVTQIPHGDLTVAQAERLLSQPHSFNKAAIDYNRPDYMSPSTDDKLNSTSEKGENADTKTSRTDTGQKEAQVKPGKQGSRPAGCTSTSEDCESKLNPLHPRYALFNKGVPSHANEKTFSSEKNNAMQLQTKECPAMSEKFSTPGCGVIPERKPTPEIKLESQPSLERRMLADSEQTTVSECKPESRCAPEKTTFPEGKSIPECRVVLESKPTSSSRLAQDIRLSSENRLVLEEGRTPMDFRLKPEGNPVSESKSSQESRSVLEMSTLESRSIPGDKATREYSPPVEVKSDTAKGTTDAIPKEMQVATEKSLTLEPMVSSPLSQQRQPVSSLPDYVGHKSENNTQTVINDDSDVKVDVVELDDDCCKKEGTSSPPLLVPTSSSNSDHPASPVVPQPPPKPPLHQIKNISYPADITKENLRYQSPKGFNNDRLEESSELKPFTTRPSVLNMSLASVPTTENVRSSIDVAEKALKESRNLPFKPGSGPILPRDIHHSAFMSRHSSYLQPPPSALNGRMPSNSIFSSRLHCIAPFSPHTSHTQSPFRAPRSSERQSAHVPINPHIPSHYRHTLKSPPDGYHGVEKFAPGKCKTYTSAATPHPHHTMFNDRPSSTGDINRHMSLNDRHASISDRHMVTDRLPLNDRHSALNERHLSLSSDRVDRTLSLDDRHPPSLNDRLLPLGDKSHMKDRTSGLSERTTTLKERALMNDISSPSPLHINHRKEKMNPFSVETLTGMPDKVFKKPEDDHPLERPPDRHYDTISRSIAEQTVNDRLHISSMPERIHIPNGLQFHNGLKRSLDEHLSNHIMGQAQRDKKYLEQIHDERFAAEKERYMLHEKERFIHHPRLPYPAPGHRSPIRVTSNYLPRSMPNGSVRGEMLSSPSSHPAYPQVHRVHPFSSTHH